MMTTWQPIQYRQWHVDPGEIVVYREPDGSGYGVYSWDGREAHALGERGGHIHATLYDAEAAAREAEAQR